MIRGTRAPAPAVGAVEAAAAVEDAGVGQQEAGAVVVARHRGARHDLERKQHKLDQGICVCVLPTFSTCECKSGLVPTGTDIVSQVAKL